MFSDSLLSEAASLRLADVLDHPPVPGMRLQPGVGEQVAQLRGRGARIPVGQTRGQVREDRVQPCPGLHLAGFALASMLGRIAARSPPAALPTNSQFFLPIVGSFTRRFERLLSMLKPNMKRKEWVCCSNASLKREWHCGDAPDYSHDFSECPAIRARNLSAIVIPVRA